MCNLKQSEILLLFTHAYACMLRIQRLRANIVVLNGTRASSSLLKERPQRMTIETRLCGGSGYILKLVEVERPGDSRR